MGHIPAPWPMRPRRKVRVLWAMTLMQGGIVAPLMVVMAGRGFMWLFTASAVGACFAAGANLWEIGRIQRERNTDGLLTQEEQHRIKPRTRRASLNNGEDES